MKVVIKNKKKFCKEWKFNILSDKDILEGIYEVYAIVKFKFKDYYIINIDGSPRYICADTFVIVDESIPINWIYRIYSKKYIIRGCFEKISIKKYIGPKEFIDNKYFLLDFDEPTNFNKFYLWNYNIMLPNPIKKDLIYEIQDDNYISYEVWRYNKKQKEELKMKDYIKPINIVEVSKIFNDLFLEKIEFSSEVIEYDFDIENIVSKENYYSFISIKNNDLKLNGNSEYNRYVLLIIDTNSSDIHIFNFMFKKHLL